MSGILNPTVMWLTWRQLFAGRRMWFALAFALLPLLFTLLFRVVADDGDATRVGYYQSLSQDIVIGTLLPLAAAVFGTTAFGGEVDDGTLVYLLVKPLARWQVVISKYVVATLSTFAVAFVAIILPWLILRNNELSPRMVMAFIAAAGAASVIYSALFLSLGLITKRALVVGLLYVIGFEATLTRYVAGLRSLSVREYAVSIAQATSGGTITVPGSIAMSTVKLMGLIMFLAAMAWTMRRLVRYEMAERL